MGGIAMGGSFGTLPPPTGSHRMSMATLSADTVTEQLHPAPQPLTPHVMAALLAGTMTLWVYGEIHYRDTFNVARFTRYRFEVGSTVGIRGNRMAISEEGNGEN